MFSDTNLKLSEQKMAHGETHEKKVTVNNT